MQADGNAPRSNYAARPSKCKRARIARTSVREHIKESRARLAHTKLPYTLNFRCHVLALDRPSVYMAHTLGVR
eukprot:5556853-Pleurochrysis_carterae.AAC.1